MSFFNTFLGKCNETMSLTCLSLLNCVISLAKSVQRKGNDE